MLAALTACPPTDDTADPDTGDTDTDTDTDTDNVEVEVDAESSFANKGEQQ